MTDHSLPPEHEHGDSGHQMAGCAQIREEAAVALLVHGGPAPDVLAHLGACPPCRQEYLELAALPPLLDAARGTPRGTPPAGMTLPSVHLLDRLLSEVARRRRRRHLFTALATAAAVVAIALSLIHI